MGAIGVARILSIVGLDDWAPDLPTAIELLRKFTLDLPARLVTPEGRAEGKKRMRQMERYLDELRAQTTRFRYL